MNCAYAGDCSGKIRPMWIRSVGIPLCDRHRPVVEAARASGGSDRQANGLLAAAAILILQGSLATRKVAPAA